MSPGTRSLIALVIVAVVFGVLAWLDAAVLAHGRAEALATFNMGSFAWVEALGFLAVAGGAILIAGLAWWSRSLLLSIVFVIAGLLELLVQPVVFGMTNSVPEWLNLAFTDWLTATSGPLNAALVLGAALVVGGAVGAFRWATTRQAASLGDA